jgi:hypothetical protein
MLQKSGLPTDTIVDAADGRRIYVMTRPPDRGRLTYRASDEIVDLFGSKKLAPRAEIAHATIKG